MATINHIRLARINPAIARDCERNHRPTGPGHPYGTQTIPAIDPYTRRSNICSDCHTAKATGHGVCLCSS